MLSSATEPLLLPTESTLSSHGQGCSDDLCHKKEEPSMTLLLAKAKREELETPTASTMTFQGQGTCADHLCQTKDCGDCVDDRFKPLLEFEFLDMLDTEMLAKLRELSWEPEKGNPVDYVDEYGDTLLHSAARNGQADVIQKLLEMGAPANACCQGECCCSPLMVASRWCHPECVSLLLSHGANTNHVNDHGETALDQVVSMTAGNKHDKALIISLLRNGGVPNTPTASTMTFQGQGTCADHLCQKMGCGDCVDDRFKPLLEFEFLDMLDTEMLAKLRELDWEPGKGNPVDYVDEYGDTLLHSAARNGEADVIKVLLEMGADANVCCQGECCCSPLMVASRWYHPECVSLLLRHGADTSYVNNRGETALEQVVNNALGNKHDKAQIISLLSNGQATRTACSCM